MTDKLGSGMETKFTPGSWCVEVGFDGSIAVLATRPFRINTITAGTPIICNVFKHADAEHFNGAANGRLIAAAPELLEALQSMEMALIGYVHQNDVTTNALTKCRAAIAKATGGDK